MKYIHHQFRIHFKKVELFNFQLCVLNTPVCVISENINSNFSVIIDCFFDVLKFKMTWLQIIGNTFANSRIMLNKTVSNILRILHGTLQSKKIMLHNLRHMWNCGIPVQFNDGTKEGLALTQKNYNSSNIWVRKALLLIKLPQNKRSSVK